MTVSRRGFLTALACGATAGTVPLVGCVADRSRDDGGADDGRPGALPTITRPVLTAWADGIVWMAAPSEELPVAYVSMEQRKVYVDRAHRDRAAWLLDAHISVSTALWRIPLPGDPEGEPITPGDAAREFEEMEMRQWTPATRPAMDDIRILRGRATGRRVDFRCVPMAGVVTAPRAAGPVGPAEAWVSAGPFDVRVARGIDDTTREDFMVVGAGSQHADRECATSVEAVQIASWAVRPA